MPSPPRAPLLNNILRACQGRALTFLQSSADWDTINFGGLGDGKNVGGGCTCYAWVKSRPGICTKMQTFPSGISSGGTSFPTVASRLQVKLLLDPVVHNLWKCLTPSRISPRCICRERHAHLALKISLVALSVPKLIGRLVLSSALSYIVPLFRAKSGAGTPATPLNLNTV